MCLSVESWHPPTLRKGAFEAPAITVWLRRRAGAMPGKVPLGYRAFSMKNSVGQGSKGTEDALGHTGGQGHSLWGATVAKGESCYLYNEWHGACAFLRVVASSEEEFDKS